jgi:hypothetical protein
MSGEEMWIAAGGAVALLLLVLVVLALASTVRLRREVRDLRGRLAAEERRTAPATADAATAPESTYVITGLGGEPTAAGPEPGSPVEPTRVAGPIDGRLFADIVARETVVKAGGLVHGLRRALAPEVRNRIRFEMRREVKRARKRRRADLKAALRDVRAREGDAA